MNANLALVYLEKKKKKKKSVSSHAAVVQEVLTTHSAEMKSRGVTDSRAYWLGQGDFFLK